MTTTKLVVDTNIVMSALMTPEGRIGKTILDISNKVQLIACHYLYVELFHHKDKILKINKMPESDFLELLLHLLNRFEFISEERIPSEHWQQAIHLVADIDPKDTAHVALALHLNAPLWTGDQTLITGLRAKGFALVTTTAELT